MTLAIFSSGGCAKSICAPGGFHAANCGGDIVESTGCADCGGGCGDDCCDAGCWGCDGGGDDGSPGAFPGSCGACATGGCGGISGLVLPLLSTKLACGSGCGGVYWGEWMSDPPECCDPCNDCGCWVEPRCCHHAGFLGNCWQHLKGGMHKVFNAGIYGYYPRNCCGGVGCDTCRGCGGCESCGGAMDAPYEYVEEIDGGTAVGPAHHDLNATYQRRPHRVVSRRLPRPTYDQ